MRRIRVEAGKEGRWNKKDRVRETDIETVHAERQMENERARIKTKKWNM